MVSLKEIVKCTNLLGSNFFCNCRGIHFFIFGAVFRLQAPDVCGDLLLSRAGSGSLPFGTKTCFGIGGDVSRYQKSILAFVFSCLLLVVPSSGLGEESKYAGGIGIGRTYGGFGVWAARSIYGPLGVTAALGSPDVNRVGWEIGGQLVSPRLVDRILFRGAVQYGTDDSRRGDFSWGVGAGVGFRVGPRQWLVFDY